MTEQEVINNDVQTKLAIHDEKFNSFMNSMDDFKHEMNNFRQEMRDRDNQRHAEMAEIRTLIDGSNKYVRNLTFTAIGAIAAMVVTVLLK